MSFEGTVVDGQIVFAQPLGLPNGTRVEVTAIAPVDPAIDSASTLGQRLDWFAGAIADMPADFAAEHDHYLHGTPRRGSEETR